ncbi:LETM1 domain containing 1 [Mactra antiquata]
MTAVLCRSRVVLRNRLLIRCCYCTDPKDTLGPPTRFWRYTVNKFTYVVEKYEQKLEKKSPKAFNVYKTIKSIRYIASDTKDYFSVTKDIWAGRELHTFTRRELEIYQDMQKDMWKIVSLLVLATIPVIGNAFVVIGYMFPKRLFTHHLWNEAQKEEFGQYYLTTRLTHYHNVLEHLDKQVYKISKKEAQQNLLDILHKLQTSQHPTVDEVLQVKSFFSKYPLSIEELPTLYIRQLGKIIGDTERRYHLRHSGLILLHIDRAMVREGIENMTDQDICKACLKRGLNPYGLVKEERVQFLRTWTDITKELDETNVSLLFHCPVFLTYNKQTNITLMKGKRYLWRRKQGK